jgi:hypothetical protein
MNPYPPRGVLKHSDGSEILFSQSVRFQLNVAGREDCDFDVHEDRSAMENGKSNGTIIPGAELTPYDIITTATWHEAVGCSIVPSYIIDIDPVHKRWIRQAMLDDGGIHSPHEFQLRAIHYIAFQCNQLLYIISKTGLGKSAIPLTIGLLQTGVTLLIMVHLVGLRSDQVNKSSNDDKLIEAYHLDKHRGINGKALRDHLLSLNKQEANHVSILYALPQTLQVCIFWYQCLLTHSSCNMIWLRVIDEAHTVAKDGHSFQPVI